MTGLTFWDLVVAFTSAWAATLFVWSAIISFVVLVPVTTVLVPLALLKYIGKNEEGE